MSAVMELAVVVFVSFVWDVRVGLATLAILLVLDVRRAPCVRQAEPPVLRDALDAAPGQRFSRLRL